MATKPKHSQTQIRSRACKLLGTLCENSVPRVNHAVQSTTDNRVPTASWYTSLEDEVEWLHSTDI